MKFLKYLTIFLRFRNKDLEREYVASQIETFKSVLRTILLLVGLTFGFFMFLAIFTDQQFPIHFSAVLSVSSLIAFVFFKRVQRFIFWIIFLIGGPVYLASVYTDNQVLEDRSMVRNYLNGYVGGVFMLLLSMLTPYVEQYLFVVVVSTGLRMLMFKNEGSLIGLIIFINLVTLLIKYVTELGNKRTFYNFVLKRDQMAKFRNFMDCDIDDGIAILSKTKDVQFMNKSLKKIGVDAKDFDEFFMQRIILNSELIPNLDTNRLPSMSHNRLNSLTSVQKNETLSTMVEDFMKRKQSSQTTATLIGTYKNSGQLSEEEEECSEAQIVAQNFTFKIKIGWTTWDGQDALSIYFNDVTDQETIFQLKDQEANKNRIISSISHELRTPLNGILGITQTLRSLCKDPKLDHYLNVIFNCCKLLNSLINGFLDLQLMKFNKFNLRLKIVKIERLLCELQTLFQFQCDQKGIYLKVEIDEGCPSDIITDEERLSQIIINLIGNAIKFTFKGGITLRAQPCQEDPTLIQFSVSETGLGIKEEDQKKLFKDFGKLESSADINKKGIGLGLAISQSLVYHLGNKKETISVESEYGIGTTFSFKVLCEHCDPSSAEELSLPKERGEDSLETLDVGHNYRCHRNNLARIKDSQLHPGRKKFSTDISAILNPPTNTLTSKNILIVDDNSYNLMVTKQFLDNIQKVRSYSAINGQQALDLIEKINNEDTTIHLVLMDIQMPIMDGVEATEILREKMTKGELKPFPIVALTANAKSSFQGDLFDGILEKPLMMDDIKKVVLELA